MRFRFFLQIDFFFDFLIWEIAEVFDLALREQLRSLGDFFFVIQTLRPSLPGWEDFWGSQNGQTASVSLVIPKWATPNDRFVLQTQHQHVWNGVFPMKKWEHFPGTGNVRLLEGGAKNNDWNCT